MKIAALGISRGPSWASQENSYPKCSERTLSPAVGQIKLTEPPNLTISVFDNPDDVRIPWTAFQATAHCSLYQSYIWCRAWLDTAGKECGISPRLVFVNDGRGHTQIMLPLQLRRVRGCTVLEWLTSPHMNYGGGLYRREFLPHAGTWLTQNWPLIVELIGGIDMVRLLDMPDHLQGAGNPFAGLFNIAGANRSYAMGLEPGFEDFYQARRSADDRRYARKRETHLGRAGQIAFGLPSDRQALHATIDTMFQHQESRLAERGVHGVYGPTERAFIHRIANLQDMNHPVLAPYELKVGGETLAVMLGGIFGGTYWALVSSLAQGPLRRHSPGDVTLRKTIEACCRRNLASFDFSSGQSHYKESWSDDVMQLHCHISARTWRGLPGALANALTISIKRHIKTRPALLAAGTWLRRQLRGKPSEAL